MASHKRHTERYRTLPPRSAMNNSNHNKVKKLREAKLISKAELARLAGISTLTLDRIEKGMACRIATKRKITLALGLNVSDHNKVFRQL